MIACQAAAQGNTFWIRVPGSRLDVRYNSLQASLPSRVVLFRNSHHLASFRVAPVVKRGVQLMSELSTHERIANDTPNDSEAQQVLIAEDEPVIRNLLQILLNRWGYRTLVAHDGKEALEVAEHHHGDIDLLLSDVNMPEMGGQELAEKLTKKRPAMKVILMSWYSRFQIVLRRGWEFVQKPFKSSEIREKIKKVL
jgi:CheY-like chemotaxis protein